MPAAGDNAMAIATPIPFLRARFCDRCNNPLAGGKVFTYEPNSLTPKDTYTAPISGTPNTNPIVLDAAGEADIYLAGRYRIIVQDRNGVVIDDRNDVGSWFSDSLDSQFQSINDYLDLQGAAVADAAQSRVNLELDVIFNDANLSAATKLAAMQTYINGLNITAQQKLDIINGLVATGNTEITNLQSAINVAAAAGAGANGWTDLLIATADSSTQRVKNQLLDGLTNKKKTRIIAGALRNDGAGWQFISDGAHNPMNVSSVSITDALTLRVNFAGTNAKVISGLVTTDESYARLGLQVGASVAANYMDINGYLPLAFKIQTDGSNAPIITAINEIKNRITPSRQGFAMRINHTGATKDAPQLSVESGSPPAKITSVTDTAMNILQESLPQQKYYRVRYTGGTWQLLTNDTGATLDSSNFLTTGDLIVTLGTAITGNDFANQSVSNRYPQSNAKILTSGLTSFTLRFYDNAGVLLKTAADSTMESYILYGAAKSATNATSNLPVGTYYVNRGLIPIYWDELTSPTTYGGNCNLWFIALVEYA